MGHRETILPPAIPAAGGLDAPALIAVLQRLLDEAETVRSTLRKSRHPFRVKIMQRMINVRILATKTMTDLEAAAGEGGADVCSQPRSHASVGRTSPARRSRRNPSAGGPFEALPTACQTPLARAEVSA